MFNRNTLLLPGGLSPAQFFSLSWDCPKVKDVKKKEKQRLPSTSHLFSETPFAEVYMGWDEEQIGLVVDASSRSDEDVVDLFFDTRDVKVRTTEKKFCHHFRFIPAADEEFLGYEITDFRGRISRPLSSPRGIKVQVKSNENSYQLKIVFSAVSLFGYDPLNFPRLGFTYRIGRGELSAQHFSASSLEFAIERHPFLWATINLIKE